MVKATPTKSRTPFYGLLLLLAVAGGSGIWYSMKGNESKPITLDESVTANLPAAEGYLYGDPNAKVTIMEFGDYECPTCARFATIAEPDIRARIIDAGLANFRFFDFPIPEIHPNTLAASLAASCAADQGKFWQMHDAIFEHQDEWNSQVTNNPKKLLDGYAEKVGVDMKAYGECFSSQRNLPRIQANRAAGTARGINGTPTFVINNTVYDYKTTPDDMKRVVDSLLATMPNTAPDTTKK